MSKKNCITHYKSPNIVIIPNKSLCYPPSPKRLKVEVSMPNQSPQHEDLSFLDNFNIDEIVECLNSCDSYDNCYQDNEDAVDIKKTSQMSSDQDVTIVTNENLIIECESNKNSEEIVYESHLTEFVTKNIQDIVCDNDNKKNTKTNVESKVDSKHDVSIQQLNEIVYKDEKVELKETQDQTEEKKIYQNKLDQFYYENNIRGENVDKTDKNIKDTIESLQFDNKSKGLIVEEQVPNQENINFTIQNKKVETIQNIMFDDDALNNMNYKHQVDFKYTHISIQESNEAVDENRMIGWTKIQDQIVDQNKNDSDLKEIDSNRKQNAVDIIDKEKKDSKQNDVNVSSKNNKIKIVQYKYIEQTETKSINSIKFVTPKSVMHSRADIILSRQLENRMYKYLHIKYTANLIVHYGRFSKIFKCFDPASKPFAVKVLNREWGSFDRSIKQDRMFMDIQADIPKDNLFTVYVLNSFSMGGYWCFLMEFHPKNLEQALEELNKPFHIDLVQELARQLVAAVTVLRSKNIIHSNIKPSHILINNSNTRLKLCGFDDSYYCNEIEISSCIGSVNYRPPEVILGYSAGFSIDVWTTALVLHEMATGGKLFPGYYNGNILYKQICTLGTIPHEMLQGSRYKADYFVGGMFRRRCGYKGQSTALICNFYKNDRLKRSVDKAYFEHWMPFRSEAQKDSDLRKIQSFHKLLNQMLVICPVYRISIEFVYADPFIYEMSD